MVRSLAMLIFDAWRQTFIAEAFEDDSLARCSHIGLTGDYVWSNAHQPRAGTLRPLRQGQSLLAA
jgi:hypothetical protein